MSRTSLGIAAVGVALALAATACGGGGTSTSGGAAAAGGATTVKLMVGGLNKQIYLPAMLTQQLGYFKDEGLDVQLSDEPAGVDAEDAMLAGQVDGVVGFYDHTLDLQGKGKQVESVVQLQQAPGEVELCRSDEAGSISSPADWKGKRLGVTGLGSSTNFLTKYLAVHSGLSEKDITSVAVEAGPTFIAAMQHKEIDCGMTTEPTVSQLLNTGQAKVLIDMRTPQGAKAALGGTYPAASVYMQTSWVDGHKDAVQKLVNAFVKTMKWIQAHSAAEITDKMPPAYYAGVGKDQYVKALDAEKAMFTADGVMPADGPQTVLTVLTAFDPSVKGHTIDLGKTYTTQFANSAH
ncbi:ABC transporter substrate-binding protein [Gandjariella thermophila]|uniref:ABC transporter substrate-binding protein n=1 Tax=Gandjariella thermophila TaxID=1931992 RepID=A0A4D4JCE2_9PSEU|nr:ABC transporter substrate-binding protein [Gandjariella thermophila]GDY32680.1 ABC transporter substrate-binding protein [Gandjariella thermophila]